MPSPGPLVVGIVHLVGADTVGWSDPLAPGKHGSGFVFDGPAGGILYFPPPSGSTDKVTMTIEIGGGAIDKLEVATNNDGAIAAGVTRGFALVELELNHNKGTGTQGRVATVTRVLDGSADYPMIAADVIARIDRTFERVDKAKVMVARSLLARDARKRSGWSWRGEQSQRSVNAYLDDAHKRLVIVRSHLVGGSYAREIVVREPAACPKCLCSGGTGPNDPPRNCAPCIPCRTPPPKRTREQIFVHAMFAVRYEIDAKGRVVRETRFEPQLEVGGKTSTVLCNAAKCTPVDDPGRWLP